MSYAEQMIQTHPSKTQVDVAALTECIRMCFDCAQSCTSCADACLGEEDVQSLVRCIRLNLDCADVCAATGKVLSRSGEAPVELLQAVLQTCMVACRLCGEECQRHAHHREHCRVCAEACRRCEEACDGLLAAMAA